MVCFDTARTADIAALCALEYAAFPATAYDQERLKARQFQYLICRANAEFSLLRDRHGQLLGYAVLLYRRGSHTARLYSLAIQPHYQGSGLGKLLMSACETLAVARGCQRIHLEALQPNTALIHFYQQQGYQPLATLPGYYSDHQDGLRLAKTLSPAPSTPPSPPTTLYPCTNI